MFTNASVTITRRGDAYNAATGYRESSTATEILDAVRCTLSQGHSSPRLVNREGLRDFVKPSYSLLIPGHPDVSILPGDQAAVTPDKGPSMTFTVNDAIPSPGIGEFHWECGIERVSVPA